MTRKEAINRATLAAHYEHRAVVVEAEEELT